MSHYFSKKQDSPLRLREVSLEFENQIFSFLTGSGTFSPKKIDSGTMILIKYMIVKPEWRVLDLGCGYGPVGIVAAKLFPSARVVMSDVNERAIGLAVKNVKRNSIKNAEVIESDLFENIKEKFNTVLCNPPQTAGKKVCFSIIEQSKDYLLKDGLLQIVARHNKGGKALSGRMEDVFGNVSVLGKKAGYRVYCSKA
ncbi:class I SAM-dependent methyltransferase [Candidatus Woesearchaeota archaeon]|nr:MAG: class I SAM-dependent methyltransferase [Candidatus Woesearchaeota archaeon]